MKTITFIFPAPSVNPAGGYKVAYEYANRLVADGHKVNIVYAGSIFWTQKTPYYKATNCIRYIQRWLKGYSCRNWFPLDKRVREVFALSLNFRHIPKSDIYIATSPHTAMYVKDYPVNPNNKYYFIQGYENWGDITDAMLHRTYHYNMHKIVISRWLADIIKKDGLECDVVPNGFDFNYFRLTVPIEEKNPYSVVMTYNTIENKGCQYGMEAFYKLKRKFPQFKVVLFGSIEGPQNLPDWIIYYRSPNKELHNKINNESAIFLSTSIQEGWGLTIGEAMMCGQAVVCSDNLGHREMAIPNKNALMFPIKDSDAIVKNISSLIENEQFRQTIATNGYNTIKKFNIELSYLKLKKVLQID